MLGVGLKLGVPSTSVSVVETVDPDTMIEYDGVSLLVDGQYLTYGNGSNRSTSKSLDKVVQYNRSSVQANGDFFTHQSTPRPLPSVKKIYANLTDLLVAHWKLDETSGTRYDSVGTANLTPGSLDETTLAYIQGIIGNAADFNNSTYLQGSYTLPLTGREGAFSLWIKSTIDAEFYTYDDYVIVAFRGNPLSFYITGNGHIGGSATPGGDSEECRLRSTTAINDGQWHHLVITSDGNTQKMYIDGTLETQDGDFGLTSPVSNQSQLFENVGAYPICINTNDIHDFATSPCSFDSVSIWNRNLTQSDVAKLYNNGAALDLEDF